MHMSQMELKVISDCFYTISMLVRNTRVPLQRLSLLVFPFVYNTVIVDNPLKPKWREEFQGFIFKIVKASLLFISLFMFGSYVQTIDHLTCPLCGISVFLGQVTEQRWRLLLLLLTPVQSPRRGAEPQLITVSSSSLLSLKVGAADAVEDEKPFIPGARLFAPVLR